MAPAIPSGVRWPSEQFWPRARPRARPGRRPSMRGNTSRGCCARGSRRTHTGRRAAKMPMHWRNSVEYGAESRPQCAQTNGHYGVPLSGGGQRIRFARTHEVGDVVLDGTSAHLPPRMRCLAYDPAECTSEMRLIAHAAAECNFTQGRASRHHESLRDFDAPAPDPGSGGGTKGGFEGAAKVAGTEVHQCCKIPDANLPGKVGINVGPDPPCLPWRKSAAQGSSRSEAGKASCCRQQGRLTLKERQRVANMGFSRPCVAGPCATRGLDELSGHGQTVVRRLVLRRVGAGSEDASGIG
jgi:hypothetical protein